VSTVPCPLIAKQWSIEKWKGPFRFLLGTTRWLRMASSRSSMPRLVVERGAASSPSPPFSFFDFPFAAAPPDPPPSPEVELTAATFSPPIMAEVTMMAGSWNFVSEKILRIRRLILSILSLRSSAGMRSTLLSTMMSESVVISPITMHSAVWVWIPLLMSTTSTIMSMI
jgi:hypothetical protein